MNILLHSNCRVVANPRFWTSPTGSENDNTSDPPTDATPSNAAADDIDIPPPQTAARMKTSSPTRRYMLGRWQPLLASLKLCMWVIYEEIGLDRRECVLGLRWRRVLQPVVRGIEILMM